MLSLLNAKNDQHDTVSVTWLRKKIDNMMIKEIRIRKSDDNAEKIVLKNSSTEQTSESING